jgi:hypothetical protein
MASPENQRAAIDPNNNLDLALNLDLDLDHDLDSPTATGISATGAWNSSISSTFLHTT